MAEQPKATVTEPKPNVFYTLPQEPPTIYVDAFQPFIRDTEVKIKLGDRLDATDTEQVVRLAYTVAMSHRTFLTFVDMMNNVAKMVREIYGEPSSKSLEEIAQIVAQVNHQESV